MVAAARAPGATAVCTCVHVVPSKVHVSSNWFTSSVPPKMMTFLLIGSNAEANAVRVGKGVAGWSSVHPEEGGPDTCDNTFGVTAKSITITKRTAAILPRVYLLKSTGGFLLAQRSEILPSRRG